MNRFVMLMLLMLSLLATSVPRASQAAEITQYTGGILSAAFASRESADPEECMLSVVSFYAGDGMSGPGKGVATAWINLVVERHNLCTNEMLILADGFARLDSADIEVTKQLNTALLRGTVDVTDMITGETFAVSLDVAWTGVGNTAYIRRHSQIKKPGFMLNSNGSIAMRGADATGTVKAPWVDMTSIQSNSAEMWWVSNSTLTLDQ